MDFFMTSCNLQQNPNIETCFSTGELLNLSWLSDGPCLGKPQSHSTIDAVSSFFHRKCLYLIDDSQKKASDFFNGYDFQPASSFQADNATDLYRVQAAVVAGLNLELPLTEDHKTLLHIAAKQGSLDYVRVLANSGIDVNIQDANNKTPLIHAASNGKLAVVQFLLSHGAKKKIDHYDNKGESALFHAINGKHRDVVKALIKAGANVNQYGIFKNELTAPLLEACEQGDTQILRDLIAAGADVHEPIKAKVSPRYIMPSPFEYHGLFEAPLISLAALHGTLEAVKILVEAGVRLDGRSTDGHTLLDHAWAGRKREIYDFLKKEIEKQWREEVIALISAHQQKPLDKNNETSAFDLTSYFLAAAGSLALLAALALKLNKEKKAEHKEENAPENSESLQSIDTSIISEVI